MSLTETGGPTTFKYPSTPESIPGWVTTWLGYNIEVDQANPSPKVLICHNRHNLRTAPKISSLPTLGMERSNVGVVAVPDKAQPAASERGWA